MKLITFFLTLWTLAASVHAADDIELGYPGHGGTGCPQGTVSATLSPDQKSLSIIFDQYMAEVGRSVGRRLDRKSCNVAIPIRIPQGFSVSIVDIDYRGYNFLPRGSRSTLNVEYFFAGVAGPRFSKTFLGNLDAPYTIQDKLGIGAVVWSACGAVTNLRINTGLMLQANSSNHDALSTVDSIDLSAGLVYHLQWRRC